MRIINKVKLFIKDNNRSHEIADMFKAKLLSNNYIINENDFDLAISIGGDGTFLKMVSECNFNNNIYFIGINSGNLGFLADIDLEKIDYFIDCLNNNRLNFEEMSFGKTRVIGDDIKELSFFNETVIRNMSYKTISIPIYIDSSMLEEFHGDGILISTSIGSTAYNISNNGPIVYNSLDLLIITPMSPINNKIYKTLSKSIVIPKNKIISIIPKDNMSLSITVDDKEEVFNNVNKLEISLSKEKIKCLRMEDYDYIKSVNEKLI